MYQLISDQLPVAANSLTAINLTRQTPRKRERAVSPPKQTNKTIKGK